MVVPADGAVMDTEPILRLSQFPFDTNKLYTLVAPEVRPVTVKGLEEDKLGEPVPETNFQAMDAPEVIELAVSTADGSHAYNLVNAGVAVGASSAVIVISGDTTLQPLPPSVT